MTKPVHFIKKVCGKPAQGNIGPAERCGALAPGATRGKQHLTSIAYISCLLATPLLAQGASIGGGNCNSGSLNGTYSVSITGRQVTATSAGPATYSNVFQANGSATFDGLSKVTISVTADTNQAAASPLSWSGTYSVEANCAGVVNIAAGGSATLNLVLYDGGVDFLVSGNDASYTYSGSGIAQPTGCAASTFSGVYSLTGTGFTLGANAVTGAEGGTGLLQFDGIGDVTVNMTLWTVGATPSALTLTGSYTISSSCLGSATLTDSSANTYVMSFSIYNAKASTTAFYAMLAQSSKFIFAGSGRALFGQPAATAQGGPENTRGTYSLSRARASPKGGNEHEIRVPGVFVVTRLPARAGAEPDWRRELQLFKPDWNVRAHPQRAGDLGERGVLRIVSGSWHGDLRRPKQRHLHGNR